MPQLNQLALVAQSQLFWLLLVLAFLYFGIGKLMLPKVQSTVEARDRKIADDLAAAQAARAAADETEAAYRARIDARRPTPPSPRSRTSRARRRRTWCAGWRG